MNTTEEALDFNPISTRIAHWNEDGALLKDIRRQGGLPELHPEDVNASHFISTLNNTAVACATVLENGELVLLSIIPEYSHQETGNALMRFILREIPKQGLTQIHTLNASSLQDFFSAYGFQWDEERQQLILLLPPDRTHIASGSDVIILDTLDAFRERAVELINNAQKNISIFTLDLEPATYDSAAVREGMLKLLKRSNRSEVRILVKNTQTLLGGGHELVKLYQRSSNTQFYIKKLTVNPGIYSSAYLIADDCGILYRRSDDHYRGVYYQDNRGRVRNQQEEFDQLWSVAVEEKNIKPLMV